MQGHPRDRREVPDRRRHPTPVPLCRSGRPRRRRGFRRRGEGVGCYADALSPHVTLWFVTLLVLSAVDATLTLIHIRSGGDELVPTMRLALLQGEEFFIALKLFLTAVGGLFLAAHERFRLARLFIPVMLLMYVSLMGYHIVVVLFREVS